MYAHSGFYANTYHLDKLPEIKLMLDHLFPNVLTLGINLSLWNRTKPQIAEIIKSFKGHVKKMLRHAEASAVVEYAYNDKAILEQRNMLTEELYGNTFQVYKVTSILSSLRCCGI